jgi:hypothetical protein
VKKLGIEPLGSITEMKKDLAKLRSYWSKESLLNTRMLLYLCERIDALGPKKRRSGKQSAYAKFISVRMKRGMSIALAAKQWRDRKRA